MRLPQLRRILRQVVLVGLPASLAACDLVDGDCRHREHKRFEIATPADPPMQFRIDSCRVDVDACDALCRLAMERGGVSGVQTGCEATLDEDRVTLAVSYDVYENRRGCPVEGRRPDGLRPPRLAATSAAGAWLAHAAWLEAASVHAFVRLAHELGLHGAPRGLIRGALAAVRDEVRHTTMLTRFAADHGATPSVPDVAVPVARSLEALAIENAVEGCVRETWGAALALWQSHAARDAEVRAAFRAIARDELRHAALAWAIDGWVVPRLDAAGRARVAAARAAAAGVLIDGDDAQSLPVLGIPDGVELRRLAVRTHASLWQGGHS